MVCIMWSLVLRHEFGDIIIKNYKTKEEAQQEINNRDRLTSHLGEDIRKLYYIKKGKQKDGSSTRSL